MHKFLLSTLLVFVALSCTRTSQQSSPLVIQENPEQSFTKAKEIRAKAPVKLAEGLQLSLWASDSLAPDPVAISIDDAGRVFLTRTNRGKTSEFDIRGHVDWMTESIGFQTVEDRRAFLRKTFAPEKSEKNLYLKDMNNDGIHDWHDLTVEKEEIWRVEDRNGDGVAETSTRVLQDFSEEITDVAGGVLIREKDAFISVAPDLWRLHDTNGDGLFDKKTSIATGFAVHIGFGGHGMSGVIEGPDGKIYWNIGDIGANITTKNGVNVPNPNSGIIARCNPDGSDFEIYATGLRNTHEFVFDDYGNLISSDNDGDHPGESERLVHIVQDSDAGWRSNWQYGKYTDPKNNKYKVWMDEKLYKPRWEGQAAYIIPPIMNYHNGPTGMVFNPGTALGTAWKNKFFLVEFIGSPSNSRIWSFGLKPKGASFDLSDEKNILSGILPTGIRFGPDGALYVADWINGWSTKDYGRVWRLDVTPDKNDLATERAETKRLIQLNYEKESVEALYKLLFYNDLRVRQKAQFALVSSGNVGFDFLKKAVTQSENQLARIHGIWGIGQLARQNQKFVAPLSILLTDKDSEIIAQTAKVLGDAKFAEAGTQLIPLLKNANSRVRFFAAEALGKIAHEAAIEPLIAMLKANNDEDVYLRHAGVSALAKIGKIAPILALSNNENKALRTAAVLVLRRLHSPEIAVFLQDSNEYIATEAARGINDDLSIEAALPALANCLNEPRFTGEPLLRRAINAALRIGSVESLDLLIRFANRPDISDALRAEALATIGTWANPSETDRVDGRYRGVIQRDMATVKAKISPYIPQFLQDKNPETIVAVTNLLAELGIETQNKQLANIYQQSDNAKVKSAILTSLNTLKYSDITNIVKNGMEDKNREVRTTALGLLNNGNVSEESLPSIANQVFTNGSLKEQQKLLTALCQMEADKTRVVLTDLLNQYANGKVSSSVFLELKEAVNASHNEELSKQLNSLKKGASFLDEYAEALNGGNRQDGYLLFNHNSTAQCVRCHTIGIEGGNMVGPSLTKIGSTLTREQILQALVEPSARLAPGFGTVILKLDDGNEVTGILAKETATALTLTTSDAEPLVIQTARIVKRENVVSSMPPMGDILSKREIRDLVEFLCTTR